MPMLPFRTFYNWLILSWLLIFSVQSYAQQITLNGTVSDSKIALPLSGVSVHLKSTNKTAITNNQGSFSLKTDTVWAGEELTFSHLSYETFTLRIKPGQTNFQVKLQPRNNVIPEVKITANKKLQSVKIRPETIVDYALRGNQIFVLAWESGQARPSLLVLDRQTDTLQLHYRLPFYSENLFIDCLENVHLLTATHAYQLYSDSLTLAFYRPESRALFERMLLPCQAATIDKIYFKKDVNKGIISSFYTIDRVNQEIALLYGMRDAEILKMQLNEARFQMNRARMAFDEEARYVNLNQLNSSAARSASFGQNVMFEAPYVPLLKIGENICIFDHANGKLQIYRNDSLHRAMPVNYHLQKNFSRQIIADAAQQKAYCLFRKNGLYELRQLNLETGETENTYRISQPFAKKISVANGQVYFLYKDPAKNNRQFLYKAPLNSL